MADSPAFLLLEVEVKGEGIKCVFQDFNQNVWADTDLDTF